MPTILDQEALRRALHWLDERRREEPDAPRHRLLDEAALRFNLSPLEAEFLLRNWREPGSLVP